MPISGLLSHIDLSVGYPERSIPFYDALLTALGFSRCRFNAPEWSSANPTRATWRLEYPGGASFEIETRPARTEDRDRRYDRYQPGPHHLAFHADSASTVDRVHRALAAAGGRVLDPPADYGGRDGYGSYYYAAFFADPDGLKLEVCHTHSSNP